MRFISYNLGSNERDRAETAGRVVEQVLGLKLNQ